MLTWHRLNRDRSLERHVVFIMDVDCLFVFVLVRSVVLFSNVAGHSAAQTQYSIVARLGLPSRRRLIFLPALLTSSHRRQCNSHITLLDLHL